MKIEVNIQDAPAVLNQREAIVYCGGSIAWFNELRLKYPDQFRPLKEGTTKQGILFLRSAIDNALQTAHTASS